MPFKRVRYQRVTLGALFLLVSVLSLWSGACFAHRRPPAPTESEQRLLDEPPLPFDISIQPLSVPSSNHAGEDPVAYAGPEAKTLQASHAFRASRFEVV